MHYFPMLEISKVIENLVDSWKTALFYMLDVGSVAVIWLVKCIWQTLLAFHSLPHKTKLFHDTLTKSFPWSTFSKHQVSWWQLALDQCCMLNATWSELDTITHPETARHGKRLQGVRFTFSWSWTEQHEIIIYWNRSILARVWININQDR